MHSGIVGPKRSKGADTIVVIKVTMVVRNESEASASGPSRSILRIGSSTYRVLSLTYMYSVQRLKGAFEKLEEQAPAQAQQTII